VPRSISDFKFQISNWNCSAGLGKDSVTKGFYTPEEIFGPETMLTNNIMPEKLTSYAEQALQAWPGLAPAHYVRAIGLAHSGGDPGEVRRSLSRAFELSGDPLFKLSLNYWDRCGQ
jgi:hypothetical protein